MDDESTMAIIGAPLSTPDGGAWGTDQNFAKAVPAGIAAAIVGAILWALAVFVTEMQIGFFAIGVGALVGYAIRTTGKGIDQNFGVFGGACAAFGWALGTILCDVAFVAKQAERPFFDVLMLMDFHRIATITTSIFQPMDLLFLAIAVYEGYKLSFRREYI